MRPAGGEAFQVGGVGRGEHEGPRGHALLGHVVMHVGGREQAEGRVMVLGVVPGEEDVAVGAGILDRAEARRECRLRYLSADSTSSFFDSTSCAACSTPSAALEASDDARRNLSRSSWQEDQSAAQTVLAHATSANTPSHRVSTARTLEFYVGTTARHGPDNSSSTM